MSVRKRQARIKPWAVAEVRRRRAAGEDIETIAKALGRTENSVRGIVDRHKLGPAPMPANRMVTPETQARLQELCKAGRSVHEIARLMKRSPYWVRNMAEALGLEVAATMRTDYLEGQAPLGTAPGNRAGAHTRDVTLRAMHGRCRHVTGEPGTDSYAMCGAPVMVREDGSKMLYCVTHAAVMYAPKRTEASKKRAAAKSRQYQERTTRTRPKSGAGWQGFV